MMSPPPKTRPGGSDWRREQGFALVAAVVVLVLLSGIGSLMVRISGLEQAASSLSILGARADWAARSGIEWALREAGTTGGCPSGTLGLTEGALSGFEVVIDCSASAHRESSREYTHLQIRSQASFGAPGSRDHVYRELRATLLR